MQGYKTKSHKPARVDQTDHFVTIHSQCSMRATVSLDMTSARIGLFCRLMPPASANTLPCTAAQACCLSMSTPSGAREAVFGLHTHDTASAYCRCPEFFCLQFSFGFHPFCSQCEQFFWLICGGFGAGNCHEPPGAARSASCQEPPGAARSRQEPSGAAMSRQLQEAASASRTGGCASAENNMRGT